MINPTNNSSQISENAEGTETFGVEEDTGENETEVGCEEEDPCDERSDVA